MSFFAKHRCLVAAVGISLLGASCGPSPTTSSEAPTTSVPLSTDLPATAHWSCSLDTVVTTSVPAAYDGHGFDRYYELNIDGQVAMRYLFQPSITQAQIEHVVRTSRWYLANEAGAAVGADKSKVIATLASNNATMVVPNGSHVEGQDLGVEGQELYANEIAAPGSNWYVTNDPDHRDATLEEVFHQVHDNGIGTTAPGALPDYQASLLAEAKRAHADGRWASGQQDWYAELEAEGSLAQEYIASVIDSYYGMWAHDPVGSGIYAYNTRAEVAESDPASTKLLRQFLGESIQGEAYIDPAFTGVFALAADESAAYSAKSQYLLGARLTGSNPSGLAGNELDNTLRGNEADNALDGGAGTDTAVYCSASAQYTLVTSGGTTTVTGPDGTDTLTNIEQLHFLDGEQPVPGA